MKNRTKASQKGSKANLKIRDLKAPKSGNVKGGACVKGEHLKEP
jgi:hypothetical protein